LTLIELLVVLALLFMLCVALPALFAGNFYITEDGVLKAIQVHHPQAVSVLSVERCVFDYSIVIVANRDGSRSTYVVDSNILFNYTIAPVK
jgi:hypothetical protein